MTIAARHQCTIMAIVALFAWGCDDGNDGEDDSGTDGDTATEPDVAEDSTDTGGDTDVPDSTEDPTEEELPSGSIEIIVEIYDWLTLETSPAEGASVAFDTPDGGRQEGVTGTDGTVTFDGFEWGGGTASVTGWLDGHPLSSTVGIVEDDDPLTLYIFDLEGDDHVDISGTAAGMVDDSHMLMVGGVHRQVGVFQEPGADWIIPAAPGVEFSLVALEFYGGSDPVSARGISQEFFGWWEGVVGPFTEDATVDIDFATEGAIPVNVSGSFDLPAREDSPLRLNGRPYVQVTSFGAQNSVAVGFATMIDVSTDGSMAEYDLEYIVPTGVDDLATSYILSLGDAAYSWVNVHGLPTEGHQSVILPDIPILVSPATVSTVHDLHAPIEWETVTTGLIPSIDLYGPDDEVVWTLTSPVDGTSITIPEPPSDVDEDALLGTDLLSAYLFLHDPPGPGVALERHSNLKIQSLMP